MRLLTVTALLLLPGLSALEERSPSAAPDYTLIVSASNPVASLKRRDIAQMFLKKQTRWKDGSVVMPIDQSAQSPVRSAFTKDVMRTEGLGELSAVMAYWQQQIYAGNGVPPDIKKGDAEVLAFVAQNNGAVGYVSASAKLDGVKKLNVGE